MYLGRIVETRRRRRCSSRAAHHPYSVALLSAMVGAGPGDRAHPPSGSSCRGRCRARSTRRGLPVPHPLLEGAGAGVPRHLPHDAPRARAVGRHRRLPLPRGRRGSRASAPTGDRGRRGGAQMTARRYSCAAPPGRSWSSSRLIDPDVLPRARDRRSRGRSCSPTERRPGAARPARATSSGSTRRCRSSSSTTSAALLQGDFGTSLAVNMPAMELIVDRLPASFLLADRWRSRWRAVLGLTLGVLGGLRPGSWVDRLTTGISALRRRGARLLARDDARSSSSRSTSAWLPTAGYGGISGPTFSCAALTLLPAGRLARSRARPSWTEFGKLYVQVAARARGLTDRPRSSRRTSSRTSCRPDQHVIGYDFLLLFTGSPPPRGGVRLAGGGKLAVECETHQDLS